MSQTLLSPIPPANNKPSPSHAHKPPELEATTSQGSNPQHAELYKPQNSVDLGIQTPVEASAASRTLGPPQTTVLLSDHDTQSRHTEDGRDTRTTRHRTAVRRGQVVEGHHEHQAGGERVEERTRGRDEGRRVLYKG